MEDSHTTYKMGAHEYMLIVGAIALGLVPGVLAFRYLNAHEETLMYMAGASYATHTPLQQSARTPKAQSEPDGVLVSRPEKTTDALCPNSYYMTTFITLSGEHVSVRQMCESKRDAGNTWAGASSGWESAGDGDNATMILLVFRDDLDTEGALVELVREDGVVTVSASEFEGITETATFLPLERGSSTQESTEEELSGAEELLNF